MLMPSSHSKTVVIYWLLWPQIKDIEHVGLLPLSLSVLENQPTVFKSCCVNQTLIFQTLQTVQITLFIFSYV